MSAKQDFMIPTAMIAVGLSLALPRILKDGPMERSDWVFAVVGLGIAGVIGALVVGVFVQRRRPPR